MKTGFIGLGKMGFAIASGIANNGLYAPRNICVYDVNENALKTAEEKGFSVTDSVQSLFDNCETVLFAIKPQEAKNVIDGISSTGKCKLVISIMAGVPIKTLSAISDKIAIARIMPNTCALIGQSASSICYNGSADENAKLITRKIFGAVGSFVEIDESLMDDVIPIGGSFTAYAYTFMKAFIDSSVKRGIPRDVAEKLVIQSMIGSANMLDKYGDVDTLIKNVCSKGGTTLAGLDKLIGADFERIIDDCAVACAERSKELGKI